MRLCEETMRGKTSEYTGGSADRLCGFKSAAVLQGCTPEQALVKGSRIGQLVIMPVIIADFVTETNAERGQGAFGSTGE